MGKVSAAHLEDKVSVNTNFMETIGQTNAQNAQKIVDAFQTVISANNDFVTDFKGDSRDTYDSLFLSISNNVETVSNKLQNTGNLLNNSAFLFDGINQKAGDVFNN